MRIWFGLSWVCLHGSITILSIKSNLSSSPNINHLDELILKHVSNVYLGNIIKTIFKLIVRCKSRCKADAESIARWWISTYIWRTITGIKFSINCSWWSSPDLCVECVCAIILLIRISHASQLETVTVWLSSCCFYHDNVVCRVGVALSVWWCYVADSRNWNLRVVFNF